MPRPLPRCRPGFTDHIFKTAHGVQLPLRIWPAAAQAQAQRPGPSPWLFWVHGGGYTCGKWSAPTAWISRAFAERGYAVVSVGYRLQPQASFQDMVADCVAAVAWCHARGAELGLSRTWVSGGASSGATLAAMAAHRCAPRPAAFVSVYGLVDTVHYLDDEKVRPVLDEPYIACSAAEIAALMRDRNPANASVQNPWASEFPPAVSIQECRAALGMPHWAPGDEHCRRVDMYTYVARERNLMDIIYRREAFGSEEAYRAHVARNSPHHMLDGTASFPPTFFMHGDQDAIVPTAQSTNMARRLREMGVPHQVHYEKGAGHVYDFAFETPEDPGWAENVEPCLDFVDRHVWGAGGGGREGKRVEE